MKAVITNSEVQKYIEDRWTFRTDGGSISGRWEGDELYTVYSYTTAIYQYRDGAHWVNDTHYSVTTSKQQGYVRGAAWGQDVVTVINVPYGAYDLTKYTGKVGKERAKRLASV